jgi:hypothetical protein
MQPAAKSLAGAADLGRDGADGLPLGRILILVLQQHPHRPFLNLWGISDSLAHDSILSSNGVSGNPGAVQVAPFSIGSSSKAVESVQDLSKKTDRRCK